MCVFVYVYNTWSCLKWIRGSSAHVAWSPVNSRRFLRSSLDQGHMRRKHEVLPSESMVAYDGVPATFPSNRIHWSIVKSIKRSKIQIKSIKRERERQRKREWVTIRQHPVKSLWWDAAIYRFSRISPRPRLPGCRTRPPHTFFRPGRGDWWPWLLLEKPVCTGSLGLINDIYNDV